MSLAVTPHLNFQGQAREALGFYHSVFGGRLAAFTYGELGRVHDPADTAKLVWGQVAAPDGLRIMAYDSPAGRPWHPGENAFFVSLRGDGAREIAALWDKLAEGATVLQPLAPAAWSPLYGMLKDRFGVIWVLDVAVSYAEG